MDSNTFSRQCLDQSILASTPQATPTQTSVSSVGTDVTERGATGVGKDVSDVEENLRKILKLNGTSGFF